MEALLVVAIGLQTASTLSSSRQQAGAIKAESEFRSQQQETNSRLGEIQAKDVEARGLKESEETLRKAKTLIGRQRAALAAQGIEIGTGSALDIQLETAEFGALDALTIKNNAFREATGHRIEAIEAGGRAGFTRISGERRAGSTLLAGGLTAAGDIASGVARIRR